MSDNGAGALFSMKLNLQLLVIKRLFGFDTHSVPEHGCAVSVRPKE
jgi:hypothetical protein